MSLDISIRKKLPSFALDVQCKTDHGVLGLLGASGCGKTLTMRCIAGIETPDEGHIIVNGEVFFDSQKKINLSPQQRKTALLFQNYMLFPNMTVEENVGAGIPRSVPKSQRAAIIQRELRRFDVDHFARRYSAQLSGGQQQRVALARMLAARPRIMMLDEPFSALDSYLKDLLEQNLSNLFDAYDGTIVYVSHDIDEALRFCDQIAVMESGHIMEVYQGRELADHPRSLAALKLSGVKNAVSVERIDAFHVRVPQWGVVLSSKDPLSNDVKAAGIRAVDIQRVDTHRGDGRCTIDRPLGTDDEETDRSQAKNADRAKEADNVFRMRVDRVSDSRFERSVLLSFLPDNGDVASCPAEAEPLTRDTHSGDYGVFGTSDDEDVDNNPQEQEMHFLHRRLMWRLGGIREQSKSLPQVGDVLLIRIPKDKIHFVCK